MKATKNTLIGFLAGIVLLLTIGQAPKGDKYEVTTKWSSHGNYYSGWGDDVKLWTGQKRWSIDNGKDEDTTLAKMYEAGWRLVSYQKTNASAEIHQYSWVFERKK